MPLSQKTPGFSARPPVVSASLLCAVLTASLHAGDSANTGKNLADLSLEQLMNETVTSVSKKEQKLNAAPAAISVLSNDDIRRSGATNITDALRLIPGMNVASTNSSQSAVSARGFNGSYANKLLVLVDGRTVYSPLFAGVFWDQHQVMLDDVDRIEVIRGPGATIWGANAVNGVINIVTRDSKDTQGTLLYGGGGDVQQTMAGARYGGRTGEHTYYRVYATEQSRDDYPQANGAPAQGSWSTRQAGFRLDHYPTEDSQATWQSEAATTDIADGASDAYNLNTLGRWTRDWSDRSGVEVQTYYDRTNRNDPATGNSTVDTLDFTLQHRFGLGERHNVIWGLGYRFIHGEVEQTNATVAIRDPEFNLQLFNAFVQDEITLVPDKLTLTVGTKLEHNDYTGLEVQPSVHLVFKPSPTQTLWTAVSRAVRTPSVVEAGSTFAPIYGASIIGPGGGLYVPVLVGNPELSSEQLWAYELGWRIQPARRVNVDVSLFYNDYQNMITIGTDPDFVSGTPVGTAEYSWSNDNSGSTYGGEAAVTVAPADTWRLTAAYSLLIAQVQGDASSSAESTERSAPRHQASLRSAYDFTQQWSLDGQLRYVGAIKGIPAYLTSDLRLSYRPNDHLEFALVGQNLLDPTHPEQVASPFGVATEVPRSFYGKITWRY
ncbi:MAG TPA: TonB-dependent receptor [Rariglobus sp.]